MSEEVTRINPYTNYSTGNTMLAYALYLAGVPFADPNYRGDNFYTAEQLEKWGCSSMEEAVAQGRPGSVAYYFENTGNLSTLSEAWDYQQAEIKRATTEGASRTGDINVDPVDYMRLAAIILKPEGYAAFKSLWKLFKPKMVIKNPGEVRVEGDKVIHPGFRVVSGDASEKTLNRLNL